jgi:hypothetical protein
MIFVFSAESRLYTKGTRRTPLGVWVDGTSVPLLCCLLLYFCPDHYGLHQPAQSARVTSGMFITINIDVMNRVAMRVEETVGKHTE